MKFNKKNFFKRIMCIFSAVFLLLMDVQRSYAEAIAIPSLPAWVTSAAGSLVSDLFYGFGLGSLTYELSSTTSLLSGFDDYINEKMESYNTTDDAELTEILEPIGYIDDLGNFRSYDLSGKDVVDSHSFLDSLKDSAASALAVPKALINTARSFAVQKLNFNSINSTVPVSYIYVNAATFFNSQPSLKLDGYGLNGRYHFWCSDKVWYSSPNFLAFSGTSMYFYDSLKDSTQSYTFSGGFSNGICTSQAPLSISLPSISEALGYNSILPKVVFPSNSYYKSVKFPIKLAYSAPSVDVSYADAPAVAWQGAPDLETTLKNQAQASTDGTRTEYVANAITVDNIDQALSYNSLKYILSVLAGHYGLTTVDSAINDAFISDFYAENVQEGTDRELVAQAYAIMLTYALIDNPNGNNDNNKKDFKVMNALANAYILALIANSLLPESTILPESETQIKNIQLVDSLTNTDPDPSVSPSESPDPGEDPDPGPSLSGILSWLSKIFNSITSLPGNIFNAFKSLLESIGTGISSLGETISNSRLGQWVQSIPNALNNIFEKIKLLPEALPGIKTAIENLPGIVINGFTDFFTINTAQISASYDGMKSAISDKFAPLQQIIDIFNRTDYSFSDTPPIIKMKTPNALKFAIPDEYMVVMDLTQFADVFLWCRTILTAILWVAFGKWVLDQFDVKFHVG